jgi:integrase
MEAQRYQRGSLTLVKRKSQPDSWVFRWYATEEGRRVYKRKVVGTVLQFPKRRDAEKAVEPLRVAINDGANFAPMNLRQLAAHYEKHEFGRLAFSTQEGYRDYLDQHILPKWGEYALVDVKAVDVEAWLPTLTTKKGKQLSPGTRTKLRNIMSGLFAHAIRYEWATRNPITSVRTSSKRQRKSEALTPTEFQMVYAQLEPRERTMVLMAATTGLRRCEILALRWGDLDFDDEIAHVERGVYRNVVGDTKTEASKKPVPLQPLLIEELKHWRNRSLYNRDSDFLFPSVQKNGSQPISADMILRRQIRPAAVKVGITKKVGWHSFRRGFSILLRQRGVDLKTAQELLRHANSRITLEIYQEAVTEEQREGQRLALEHLFRKKAQSNPSAPSQVA